MQLGMRSKKIYLKWLAHGGCKVHNCVLLVALSAVSVFLVFTLYKLQRFKDDFTEMHAMSYCERSGHFQYSLQELAKSVNAVLEENDLPHWLCYDTLWGQLLMGAIFPWRTDVQIGIEAANLNKKGDIRKQFARRGLEADFNYNSGMYAIRDPLFKGGVVQLIVFHEDKQTLWLRRSGWKYFRMQPDCRDPSLGCFNPYLVDEPPALALAFLGRHRFPVPHFGMNLQKFHYPHTWHLWAQRNGTVHRLVSGKC